MTPQETNEFLAALFGVIGLGLAAVLGYVQREAVGIAIKRLLATLNGIVNKRATQEHHAANGNGNSMKLATLTLDGLNERVKDIEDKLTEMLESQVTLARTQREQVEYYNKRERELEVRLLIATGEMLNRRVELPETRLDAEIERNRVLHEDVRESTSRITLSVDSMQESVNEMLEVAKTLMLKMDKLLPTVPPVPAPAPPVDRLPFELKREAVSKLPQPNDEPNDKQE